MSVNAAAIRKMVQLGLSAADIADLCEVIEEGFAQPVPDVLTKRRAYDRDRKREKRNSGGMSGGQDADVSTGKSGGIPPDTVALTRVEDITLTSKGPCSRISEPNGSSIHERGRVIALAKPNDFARFWDAYPAKVGKRAAEAAFGKAIRSIGGPDPPATLLAGLERAKLGRRWREGFIPNPATWLNQGRWEDEIEPDHGRREPPPTPKRLAHEANLARAFAGSQAAADRKWESR